MALTHSERQKRYVAKKRDAGLCSQCRNQRGENKWYCDGCAHAVAVKKRTRRRQCVSS